MYEISSTSKKTELNKNEFDRNTYDDTNSNQELFMNMNNDSSYFNTILVLGLFLILFSFVYIYGFHGILKFEKNLNYLLAIIFCV